MVIVAAGWIVAAQIGFDWHAKKFGDEAHSHNGVQCLFVGNALDQEFGLTSSIFAAMGMAFLFVQSIGVPAQILPTQGRARQQSRAPPYR